MPVVEEKVTVALFGGLGNQMFQYALGRKISLREDCPLRLDITQTFASLSRPYALGGFRIAATVATGVGRFFPHIWPRLRPMGALWRRERYVKERGFAFDPAVLGVKASVCLDGYWQSERYFADIAPQIRGDFALARPMIGKRCAIAANIATHEAVSLHVRRGDYVSNPVANAYHGTCSPEWYAAAMAQMAGRLDRPKFFVFSDDPAWARENLPGRWPCEFIEPQEDGRDFEDMHLMAMCRHHIIANSSFSWWGAWLDPRSEKRVIAPARWFKGAGHDTSDLIPESWERL